MSKRNRIIYWIVTLFLSFGMLAGGIQQMLQIGGYNEIVTGLGYPLYLIPSGGMENLRCSGYSSPQISSAERMGLCRLFLCNVRRSDFPFCSGPIICGGGSVIDIAAGDGSFMVFPTSTQKNKFNQQLLH